MISSTASASLDWVDNPLAEALVGGDQQQVSEIVLAAGEQGGHLACAASKNALSVAMRQRAQEWGRAGVRLNAIAPAPLRPRCCRPAWDARYGQAIRDYASPLGRNAQPRQASFIHGALFVDGGIDAPPTCF